jgi:hypothetical protein
MKAIDVGAAGGGDEVADDGEAAESAGDTGVASGSAMGVAVAAQP